MGHTADNNLTSNPGASAFSSRHGNIQDYLFYLFSFIYYLQLGRNQVAGVVTCYISTEYEDFTLMFR